MGSRTSKVDQPPGYWEGHTITHAHIEESIRIMVTVDAIGVNVDDHVFIHQKLKELEDMTPSPRLRDHHAAACLYAQAIIKRGSYTRPY